jgi:hypothetical protein
MYKFLAKLFWGEESEKKEKSLIKFNPFKIKELDIEEQEELLLLVKTFAGNYHVARVLGTDIRVLVSDIQYGTWIEFYHPIKEYALIERNRLDK